MQHLHLSDRLDAEDGYCNRLNRLCFRLGLSPKMRVVGGLLLSVQQTHLRGSHFVQQLLRQLGMLSCLKGAQPCAPIGSWYWLAALPPYA